MRIDIDITFGRKHSPSPAVATLAIGINYRFVRVGLCGPWQSVEPGACWWRVWLFENRSPGRGGIAYGLIRWMT